MKKFFIALVVMFSMLTNVKALDINSSNAVMYNLTDNSVVFEKDKDAKVSIASLTKIMTAYVAIQNIKDYSDTVTITSDMLDGLEEDNAAVIGFYVGEKVTYDDLLYGALLPSGADAARGLAIAIAGSESKFVTMMNEEAKKLGLENTNYTNVVGLDDTDHYSSADDVAKLLIIALKNAKFKTIFTSSSYVLSNGKTVYSTLTSTAKSYGLNVSYFEGGKTGYTTDAGRCLASVAKDSTNNIEYLLVTIDAPNSSSKAYHLIDAINIYKYYFDNYSYHTLITKGDQLIKLPTKYGKVSYVSIKASLDIKYYMDNTFDSSKITTKYNGLKIVTTNIKKGTKIGTLTILYDGKAIKKVDVILDNKVDFSILVFIKDNILYIISITILVYIALRIRHKVKIKKIRNKKNKKR